MPKAGEQPNYIRADGRRKTAAVTVAAESAKKMKYRALYLAEKERTRRLMQTIRAQEDQLRERA